MAAENRDSSKSTTVGTRPAVYKHSTATLQIRTKLLWEIRTCLVQTSITLDSLPPQLLKHVNQVFGNLANLTRSYYKQFKRNDAISIDKDSELAKSNTTKFELFYIIKDCLELKNAGALPAPSFFDLNFISLELRNNINAIFNDLNIAHAEYTAWYMTMFENGYTDSYLSISDLDISNIALMDDLAQLKKFVEREFTLQQSLTFGDLNKFTRGKMREFYGANAEDQFTLWKQEQLQLNDFFQFDCVLGQFTDAQLHYLKNMIEEYINHDHFQDRCLPSFDALKMEHKQYLSREFGNIRQAAQRYRSYLVIFNFESLDLDYNHTNDASFVLGRTYSHIYRMILDSKFSKLPLEFFSLQNLGTVLRVLLLLKFGTIKRAFNQNSRAKRTILNFLIFHEYSLEIGQLSLFHLQQILLHLQTNPVSELSQYFLDQLRLYGCGSFLAFSQWTDELILSNKQKWVNEFATYLATMDENTFNESISSELKHFKDAQLSNDSGSVYSIFGTDLNPASSLSQPSTHFNRDIGLSNQSAPKSNESINSQIVGSQHSSTKIELNPTGAPLFPTPVPATTPPNHTPAHKKRRLLNSSAQIAKGGGLDPKSSHAALDQARKQARHRSVSPASKQLQFKKSKYTNIALTNFLNFKNQDSPILFQRFKQSLQTVPTPSITTSTTLEDIDMLASHALTTNNANNTNNTNNVNNTNNANNTNNDSNNSDSQTSLLTSLQISSQQLPQTSHTTTNEQTTGFVNLQTKSISQTSNLKSKKLRMTVNNSNREMKSAANEPNLETKSAANEPNLEMKPAASDSNLEMKSAANESNSIIQSAANESNLEMKSAANDSNLEMKSAANDSNLEMQSAANEPNTEAKSIENDTYNTDNMETKFDTAKYTSPAEQSINERELLRTNPSFKLIFKDLVDGNFRQFGRYATGIQFYVPHDQKKVEIDNEDESMVTDCRHINHDIDACEKCQLPPALAQNETLLQTALAVANNQLDFNELAFDTRQRVAIINGYLPPQPTPQEVQFRTWLDQQNRQSRAPTSNPTPPHSRAPTSNPIPPHPRAPTSNPTLAPNSTSNHDVAVTTNKNTNATPNSSPSSQQMMSQEAELSPQYQRPPSRDWNDLVSNGSVSNLLYLKEPIEQQPMFLQTSHTTPTPHFLINDPHMARMTMENEHERKNAYIFDTNKFIQDWGCNIENAVERNKTLSPHAKSSLTIKMSQANYLDFTDPQICRNYLNPEMTDDSNLKACKFWDQASDQNIHYLTSNLYENMHAVALLGRNHRQDFNQCAAIDIAFTGSIHEVKANAYALISELALRIGGNWLLLHHSDIIGFRIFLPQTEWLLRKNAQTKRAKNYLAKAKASLHNNNNNNNNDNNNDNNNNNDLNETKSDLFDSDSNDISDARQVPLDKLEYLEALKIKDYKLYHVSNQLNETDRKKVGLNEEFCIIKNGLIQFNEKAKEYNHITFYLNRHGHFLQHVSDVESFLRPDLERYMNGSSENRSNDIMDNDNIDNVMTHNRDRSISPNCHISGTHLFNDNFIPTIDVKSGRCIDVSNTISIGNNENSLNVPNINNIHQLNLKQPTFQAQPQKFLDSLRFMPNKADLKIDFRNKTSRVEVKLNLPQNQYHDEGDQFELFKELKHLINQYNYQCERHNARANYLNSLGLTTGLIYPTLKPCTAAIQSVWRHKKPRYDENNARIDAFNAKQKNPANFESKKSLFRDTCSVIFISRDGKDIPPELHFTGKIIKLIQIDADKDEMDICIEECMQNCKGCLGYMCPPNYCQKWNEVRRERESIKAADDELRWMKTMSKTCTRCGKIGGHWMHGFRCNQQIRCANCGGNHRATDMKVCPLAQCLAARIMTFKKPFIMNSKYAYVNDSKFFGMKNWVPTKTFITPTPSNWQSWHTKQALVDFIYDESMARLKLQQNEFERILNCKKSSVFDSMDHQVHQYLEKLDDSDVDIEGNKAALAKYRIDPKLSTSNEVVFMNRRYQALALQRERKDEQIRREHRINTSKIRYFENSNYKDYRIKKSNRKDNNSNDSSQNNRNGNKSKNSTRNGNNSTQTGSNLNRNGNSLTRNSNNSNNNSFNQNNNNPNRNENNLTRSDSKSTRRNNNSDRSENNPNRNSNLTHNVSNSTRSGSKSTRNGSNNRNDSNLTRNNSKSTRNDSNLTCNDSNLDRSNNNSNRKGSNNLIRNDNNSNRNDNIDNNNNLNRNDSKIHQKSPKWQKIGNKKLKKKRQTDSGTNESLPLCLSMEPKKQQQIVAQIRKQQQQKIQQQRQQQRNNLTHMRLDVQHQTLQQQRNQIQHKRPRYQSDFDTSSESDTETTKPLYTNGFPVNATGVDDQIIQLSKTTHQNPFTKQNKHRKRQKAKQARKEQERQQQNKAIFEMCDSTHKAINNKNNNNKNKDKNYSRKDKNPLRKDKNYSSKNSSNSKSKPMATVRPGIKANAEDGKKTLNASSMQSRLEALQQQAKQQTGLDFTAPSVSGANPPHRPPPAPNIIQPHEKDPHQFARMQTDFRAGNFVPTVTPFINVLDQQSSAVSKDTADHQ